MSVHWLLGSRSDGFANFVKSFELEVERQMSDATTGDRSQPHDAVTIEECPGGCGRPVAAGQTCAICQTAEDVRMVINKDGGDLFNAYQHQSAQAALYPKSPAVAGVPLYPVLGLCDEAGEVAAKFKKCLRGDKPLSIDDLRDELGDCLWYLAAVAREAGIPLSSVAMRNLEKLKSRVERGVVKGDGDNR